MKRTRNPALSFAMLLFAIPALMIGCGGDDDDPTTPPADTTDPTVSLAASQDIVRSSSQLVLTATASDAKTLATVTFKDGDVTLAVDDEAPYLYTVDLTGADDGIHAYQAVAEDAAGNWSSSEVVVVVVYIDPQVGFVNGGFDTDAAGWELLHVSEDNGWTDAAGNPPGCIQLNEYGTFPIDPGITQTVDGLMPGVDFVVSGDYRPYVAWIGNQFHESFVVTVDSVVVGSFARGPNGEDWSEFEATFTATAESHVIGFWAEYDGDDSSYEIDNVVIEPGS